MKYPDMRNELLGHLEALSDLTYQGSCWVLNKCPEDIEYDELDYTVHFLFDDTTLSTEADKWIGLILKNDEEAASVQSLCSLLDNIFKQYGYDKDDSEYIELAEWVDVVSAAKSSLKVFKGDVD